MSSVHELSVTHGPAPPSASDAFNRREIYLDIVGFQPQSTQESLQLICSSLEAIDLYLQKALRRLMGPGGI